MTQCSHSSVKSSGMSHCVTGLAVPDIRTCKPTDRVSHPKRLQSSCNSSCKCYVHDRSYSSLYLWVPFPVTHSTATPGHQAKAWKKVPWTLGWGAVCCKFVLRNLWKAHLMIKFLCWLGSVSSSSISSHRP